MIGTSGIVAVVPGDDVVQGGAVVAVVGALCICGHKAWGGGVAKVKKCRISWLAFVYYYDWSRGQPFVPRENTSKVDKIDIEGLGRWWSSSWSNSACERARDLIFF